LTARETLPENAGDAHDDREQANRSAVLRRHASAHAHVMTRAVFPEHGSAASDLFAEMETARANDVDWKHGRVGLYVHYAGDDVLDVAKEAYERFFSENALGPKAFPSLRKFESDVVDWTLDLLHAPPGASGVMSSGGTESLFLALATARDWARESKPAIQRPEIVIPWSAHPAFDKAAHYLGLVVKRLPLRSDFRADVDAMAGAITRDTILVAGSAPALPHGVIDPIADIVALARGHDLWCHVDACVGGFMAPFVKRAGYPVSDFDFALEGVTSISADLHKYGFTAKGASLLLLADASLARYLVFEFDNWPRGHYSSATFRGTRPGGAIASAWAVMRYLGVDGYTRIARTTMAGRDRLIAGIRSLDGFHVIGAPELTVMGYGATGIDIDAVAQELGARGWFVTGMATPPGIHTGMLSPAHAAVVDQYLADLRAAVAAVRSGTGTTQARAMDHSYGG
jgi:glutamate/tyrosine decarboxylase-like PLP-dependent enzyme